MIFKGYRGDLIGWTLDGAGKKARSFQQDISSYNPYNMAMLATKRIPVTETVWIERSTLVAVYASGSFIV